MSRFEIHNSNFGPYDTLILRNQQTAATAEIALRGATLLSLILPTDHGPASVIGGYRTAEDFTTLTGARSAILAPYSNRIEDGAYHFDNVSYQFADLDDDGNSIHGLVMDADWKVSQSNAGNEAAMVELTTECLLDGACPAYPFNLIVRARFTLSADGLDLNIEAENRGRQTAPVGLGWHPYVQPPREDIRHCELQLPHRCAIAVDQRRIPLPGDDAYVELNGEPHDFSGDYRNLNGQALDVCFVGAEPGDWLHSHFYDPDSDIRIVLSQERGVVQIYTSHNLPYRLHESLALEPNEFMPNAFNRPELAGAVRLAPGRTRTYHSRISVGAGRGIR